MAKPLDHELAVRKRGEGVSKKKRGDASQNEGGDASKRKAKDTAKRKDGDALREREGIALKAEDGDASKRRKESNFASKKKPRDLQRSGSSNTAKPSSKSANLSEERVVESDNDDASVVINSSNTKLPRDKTADKGLKVSTQSAEAAKPKQPQRTQAPTTIAEESDTTASTTSSNSSVPPPEPQNDRPNPVQVNGIKRKASKTRSESSSEDSSSSEDEEEEEERASIQEKPSAKRTKTAVDSDTQQPESSSSIVHTSTSSFPAAPFNPPPGYAVFPTTDLDSSSLFARNSLSTKQIWHITAPSNVPIQEISEVALSSIQSQQPVLSHNGMDYVLTNDSSRHTRAERLLLPGSDGYSVQEHQISEYLCLQQKIVLPNLTKHQADVSQGSRAAGNVSQASVSVVRPQPKGMKMRYKPPGFGKGEGGLGSDSEADESRSVGGLQFPAKLGMHGASDKPDGSTLEKGKKKDKKRGKGRDTEMVDAERPLENGISAPLKKAKKDRASVDDVGSEHLKHKVAASKKMESEEEKTRRKELKRKKKEAKAQADVH